MLTTDLPVVIIGAGLAGLACAARLHAEQVPVVVLEAAEAVGGRIRTDVVDGFTIDRGFQVLNTAYPALQTGVDVDRLALRRLPRGVRIRRQGALHDIRHPLASPGAALGDLTTSVVGLRSKVALARYVASSVAARPSTIKGRADVEARAAWAQLPDDVVDDVLTAFFAGVVLEAEITTSRVFTDLMMRMFVHGNSAVPAAGMQALPEELARQLPAGTVRLGTPVASVVEGGVALADGPVLEARGVVVAADPWTAHELLPELGAPPAARAVTTYYFAAAPWADIDPLLTLDADGSGVVNSVVLTASAPEYSTDGRALVATSVLHATGRPVLDAAAAQAAARELHQAPGGDWELVATRDVPHALPAMTAPHPLRKPVEVIPDRLWVAGDHRDTSSIQGALVSGRRTANLVATALRSATAGRTR
ncbi:FAD-dependent oxidoreductase [Nocardioides sp. WS12]|uniref:FAD-dependent oxidoreductase n=1 Tax=Nocardioides sp. WS12 TaxID=2486272 RepID=UPI0015FE752F|nr:FAD-dependent oxidoreductase [Nocardioides sp. WS12]